MSLVLNSKQCDAYSTVRNVCDRRQIITLLEGRGVGPLQGTSYKRFRRPAKMDGRREVKIA